MENYPRSGSATAQHFFFCALDRPARLAPGHRWAQIFVAPGHDWKPVAGPTPAPPGTGPKPPPSRRPPLLRSSPGRRPEAGCVSRSLRRCSRLQSEASLSPVCARRGPPCEARRDLWEHCRAVKGRKRALGILPRFPHAPPPLMSLLLGLRLDPSVLAPKPSLGRPYCLFLWSRQTRRNHGGSPACAFTPFGITIEHAGCYFQPSC